MNKKWEKTKKARIRHKTGEKKRRKKKGKEGPKRGTEMGPKIDFLHTKLSREIVTKLMPKKIRFWAPNKEKEKERKWKWKKMKEMKKWKKVKKWKKKNMTEHDRTW